VSFEKLLPPFEKIVTDYGVDPPAAFYLWRPILAEKIRQYDVDLPLELQRQKIIKGRANSEKSSDSRNDPENQSSTTDIEMHGVPQETASTTLAISSKIREAADGDLTSVDPDEYIHCLYVTDHFRPWHPALRAFINEAQLVLEADVWNYLRCVSFILSAVNVKSPVLHYVLAAQSLRHFGSNANLSARSPKAQYRAHEKGW
jgi:hypothetical protein